MSRPVRTARTVRVAIAAPAGEGDEIGRWIGGLAGHEVVATVDRGDEALRLATARGADLIVAHASLADPDAFELLEQLRVRGVDVGAVLVAPAPDPAFERRALRAGALDVLRMPLDGAAAEALGEAVREASRRRALRPAGREGTTSAQAPALGTLVAVVSGKGGVGRSFVAASVASVLAERETVALCDLDLQFGDLSGWGTETHPERTIDHLAAVVGAGEVRRADVEAIAEVRFGKVTLLPGPRSPVDGAIWASDRGARALALAGALRGWYDWVVIDGLPGLLEPVVGLARRAQLLLVVTTCEVGSLRATKRYLELLDRFVPVPRIVVANRSDRGAGKDLVRSAVGDRERIAFLKEDATFARRLVVEGLAAAQQRERGVSRSFAKLADEIRATRGVEKT
jgi:MinD-like ATPase involved in chromosome partitioning or flagellar assembly